MTYYRESGASATVAGVRVIVDYNDSSMSMPLCDTLGSVQRLRLKQHGRRSPERSFTQAMSILRKRVAAFLVARIQRTQSQRACGVIANQSFFAAGFSLRAIVRSVGTSGSGHTLQGSITTITMLSQSRLTASQRFSLSLNQ